MSVPAGPRTGRRFGWTAMLAVMTAAAVNVPILYLLVRVGGIGWRRYAEIVLAEQTVRLFGRTALLVGAVVATAVPLAVLLAWLVTRTDLPTRRLWAMAAALPLVFPSYVAAFSWVAVWGPRGWLQKALAFAGVETLPGFAYGFVGAWLVLALFTYPYVFLLTVGALKTVDPATEEAARSLGRGRLGVFLTATLPQLRPALYGGGLLVALYTLSDFGAVSIVRFNTFTLSIYNAYQGLFDRSVAAALASLLVAATLVVIAVENRLARRVRTSGARPAGRTRPVRLGRWRAPALLCVGTIALLNLVAPLAVIVHWAVRALRVGNPLEIAGEAAVNSLGVAALAALVAVALSLPAALWSTRPGTRPGSARGGKASQAVLGLSYSGYALPGIVVALSLVFLTTRLARPLYQSLAVLIFAYLVRFLPEALAATRSSLLSLDRRYEEAARSLGDSPAGVLRRVTLPLIRPGLAAGAGLVFLTTMKELPATLILRPTGFDTLATRVWTAASENIFSQAALPALILVGVSALPVYALILRPVLRDGGPASSRPAAREARPAAGEVAA